MAEKDHSGHLQQSSTVRWHTLSIHYYYPWLLLHWLHILVTVKESQFNFCTILEMNFKPDSVFSCDPQQPVELLKKLVRLSCPCLDLRRIWKRMVYIFKNPHSERRKQIQINSVPLLMSSGNAINLLFFLPYVNLISQTSLKYIVHSFCSSVTSTLLCTIADSNLIKRSEI